MSRAAILSDIHGYARALDAVLRDANEMGCQRLICLGDLIEGGDENDAVVSRARARFDVCLRGNHDEEHDCVLTADSEAFLRSCPSEVRQGDVLYAHESPAARGKVTNPVEAWRALEACDARLIIVGDAHVPGVYRARDDLVGEAARVHAPVGEWVELDRAARYVMCPGSVGAPRDGGADPQYLIMDGARVQLRTAPVQS